MESKHEKILNLSYPQLKDLVGSLGEPSYRADQLLQWIYKKLATTFAEMGDLPQPFREQLASNNILLTLKPVVEKISSDGQTRKILFRTHDNKTIETGLMLYSRSDSGRERRTVCVSTQVGCAVGCPFCATGQQGFERNLEVSEIIEQVLYFVRFIKNERQSLELDSIMSRRPVTNIVFMGMGEPLANYEALTQTIIALNSKKGLNLGARQMTVSTAGLLPQINRLAEDNIPVELAVSLHAASDRLRDKLVPINRRYPLNELITACREHYRVTGRRPTFEYALFRGINDTPEQAVQLADLLRGLDCLVNLIAGNLTADSRYEPSPMKRVLAFEEKLRSCGIPTTLRVSRGIDIEAGCGQLRSRWIGRCPKHPDMSRLENA